MIQANLRESRHRLGERDGRQRRFDPPNKSRDSAESPRDEESDRDSNFGRRAPSRMKSHGRHQPQAEEASTPLEGTHSDADAPNDDIVESKVSGAA